LIIPQIREHAVLLIAPIEIAETPRSKPEWAGIKPVSTGLLRRGGRPTLRGFRRDCPERSRRGGHDAACSAAFDFACHENVVERKANPHTARSIDSHLSRTAKGWGSQFRSGLESWKSKVGHSAFDFAPPLKLRDQGVGGQHQRSDPVGAG